LAHGQTAQAPFGQDLLSCSPAPCVLPPVQASDGKYATYDAPIVADPANPQSLLLGAVGGECGSMGTFLSTDGGSSWMPTACMGGIVTQKRVYYPAGQPMVGYDLDGNGYVAGEYIDSMGVGFGLIAYEKSRDGVNWSQPQLALTRGYERLINATLTIDANAQSPWTNSLYVSAVAINEPSQRRNQVFVSHSSDGGRHWTPVAVDAPQLYPGQDRFTSMATGKDGTVYVTWQHCATGGPAAGCVNGQAYMVFSKSIDGGNTWSEPMTLAKITISPTPCNCYIGNLPNTNNIPISNYPVIGVDNSNGPYAGSLYVTMYSWTGTYMQVQVVRSTDGGNTWSEPVPVAPPNATHDQFLPWLSVSNAGLVGVTWMDRRNDPANVKYQPFAAFSHNGGQSFGASILLNQKFSDPNIQKETYMGDYATNTWVGSNFVSAWMDSSNGVEMQDVVGGIRLR